MSARQGCSIVCSRGSERSAYSENASFAPWLGGSSAKLSKSDLLMQPVISQYHHESNYWSVAELVQKSTARIRSTRSPDRTFAASEALETTQMKISAPMLIRPKVPKAVEWLVGLKLDRSA